MTRSEFISVLRALHNVEPYDLAEACPAITNDHQRRMVADPVRFMLRADEEQGDALWRLMQPLTRVALAPAQRSVPIVASIEDRGAPSLMAAE